MSKSTVVYYNFKTTNLIKNLFIQNYFIRGKSE